MKARKPYPEAFTQEAVRLVTDQGMRPSQVARDLDLDIDTLRRWLRVASTPPTPSTAPTAAELTQLRRENEQLRMERDMLKKAIGIFSRMPQ